MENSPTGTPVADTSLPTEPTGEAQEIVAAEQNQETISQETVSETTTATTPTEANAEVETKQTEKQAEVETTDDGLAKFAKSQGFDPESLTDGERRALKIAHDNQKAYRSNTNKSKIAEVKADVDGNAIAPDEIESFRQEFRQYQATKQAEQFFSQEGRDDTFAPVMSEILEEKKAAHGADYARVLSGDLELLYDLAVIRKGGAATVDADAIRREERESINKQLAAAPTGPHATTNTLNDTTTKITQEWIQNEYNPRNPEHVKLVDQYFAGQ